MIQINDIIITSKIMKRIYNESQRIRSCNPAFIAKKASSILPTYYEPSQMKVADLQTNSTVIHITKFEEPSEIIYNRIGGWMEKALELRGYKTINISITKSLAKGSPFTEFQVLWR